MIANGFVHAGLVSSEKIKKVQDKKDSNMTKLYAVLAKKGLSLSNSTKSNFNKAELKLIESVGLMHYLAYNE